MLFFVFFFKQKTAYEMRISDWSSDVCSSDLHNRRDGTEDFPVRDPHVAGDAREDGRLDIIAAVDAAQQACAAGPQCRTLVDGRLAQALHLVEILLFYDASLMAPFGRRTPTPPALHHCTAPTHPVALRLPPALADGRG